MSYRRIAVNRGEIGEMPGCRKGCFMGLVKTEEKKE
jgi:hypothetical protein